MCTRVARPIASTAARAGSPGSFSRDSTRCATVPTASAGTAAKRTRSTSVSSRVAVPSFCCEGTKIMRFSGQKPRMKWSFVCSCQQTKVLDGALTLIDMMFCSSSYSAARDRQARAQVRYGLCTFCGSRFCLSEHFRYRAPAFNVGCTRIFLNQICATLSAQIN